MKGTKLKHYLLLLTNQIKSDKPVKITWSNIKAVIQSLFRQAKRNISGFELEDHLYEQIIWRRTQVSLISSVCWRKGFCRHCGCEILGKTMEDRACSNEANPCYPAMMTQEEWKIFKTNNNIKLFD